MIRPFPCVVARRHRTRRPPIALALAMLLYCCAGPAAAADAPAAASAQPGPVASGAPSAASDPAAPGAPAAPGVDEAVLRLFRDSGFKERFAQSYLAETDIEPRVTEKEREAMLKVFELIAAEKLEEAIKLITKNRTEASSAVFDFTLANLHFQAERFEQAAREYEEAVRKYPKFRRAWKNLSLIYVRQNDFEKAAPALTRVLELGGADGITFGLLGFAYSTLDQQIAAESAYRMAILLDPKTPDWKMGLIRSMYRQERFADVVAMTAPLIKAQPERADLWLLQANAYIGLNQAAKAAENYEIVNRLGKATPDSLNILGDIYINDAAYDLAVQCYLDALRQDPKARIDRAMRAARVLTARGALKDTRHLVEELDKLRGPSLSNDEKKELLKLRARLAVAEGAGEEEAGVLKQIVELDPMDGEALILLGQHAARASDIDKAIYYYERAQALEKFEADARVRHAQLLVKQGKYDQALPLLRRAQQVNPRETVQQYLEQVERIAKGGR